MSCVLLFGGGKEGGGGGCGGVGRYCRSHSLYSSTRMSRHSLLCASHERFVMSASAALAVFLSGVLTFSPQCRYAIGWADSGYWVGRDSSSVYDAVPLSQLPCGSILVQEEGGTTLKLEGAFRVAAAVISGWRRACAQCVLGGVHGG